MIELIILHALTHELPMLVVVIIAFFTGRKTCVKPHKQVDQENDTFNKTDTVEDEEGRVGC